MLLARWLGAHGRLDQAAHGATALVANGDVQRRHRARVDAGGVAVAGDPLSHERYVSALPSSSRR